MHDSLVDCEVFVGALKSLKMDMFLIKGDFEYKRADHKNNTKSTFSDAFVESENTTKFLHF